MTCDKIGNPAAVSDVISWSAAETGTAGDVTVFGVPSTDDVSPCDVTWCDVTGDVSADADRSKNCHEMLRKKSTVNDTTCYRNTFFVFFSNFQSLQLSEWFFCIFYSLHFYPTPGSQQAGLLQLTSGRCVRNTLESATIGVYASVRLCSQLWDRNT